MLRTLRRSLLALSGLLWLPRAVVLVACVAGAAGARAQTCEAFADYANEILPASFQLVSNTTLPSGQAEVEIDFQVSNSSVGSFRSATLAPSAAALSGAFATAEIVDPATVGALAPLAPASPLLSPLRLRLPPADVLALLTALTDGTLQLVVRADEAQVMKPGIETIEWDAVEEARYLLALSSVPGANPDPGAPPFAPGTQFEVTLRDASDAAASIFDGFSAGDAFFVSSHDFVPQGIPEALHFVRVVDVDKSDESGSGGGAADGETVWTLTLTPSDETSLHDLFQSASFCSGEIAHVNPPVEATRINVIDGVETGSPEPDPTDGISPQERRDFNPQPIHFNSLGIELGFDLSGQIQGHLMKPSVEIRIRNGEAYVAFDLDTDMSIAAELRAFGAGVVGTDFPLLELCFPYPGTMAVGPLNVGFTLQVEQGVGVYGSLPLAGIVGFEQRVKAGYKVGFDARRPAGERYFSEARFQPNPIEFTPPQLLDEAQIELLIEPQLRTTLRLGATYPFCDGGAGGYMAIRSRTTFGVDATADPWWSLDLETELVAGLEAQVLGLGVASYQVVRADLIPPVSINAGTTFVPPSGSAAARRPGSAQETFLSGEDQRWAITLDQQERDEKVDHTSSDQTSDGGFVVLASQRSAVPSPLAKFDRHGVLQWSQTYLRDPESVIAMPDDTLLVAGRSAWIARLQDDGTLLYSREYELNDDGGATSFCQVRAASAIQDPSGAWGAVLVGVMGRAVITQNDGCAFRVDASGDVVWSKTYSGGNIRELRGVTTTAAGDVAAVGYGQPGPLMALLDGSDGSVLWDFTAPLLGTRRGELNTVVEGENGLLYAGGTTGREIRKTGAALALRANGDGSDVRHALLFQDVSWEIESLLNANSGYFPTEGGDTPGDVILDIAAVPGGFVLVGTTGTGADAAAWIAQLNETLGVEWFRTYDGPEGEQLDSITPLPDGFLVSGFSGSVPGEPGSAADEQLLVMKLAGSGGADLLDGGGLVSRYLAPGVRASSLDDLVVNTLAGVSQPAGLIAADAPPRTPLPDDIEDLTSEALPTCVVKLTGSGRESANLCDLGPDTDGDGVEDERDNCSLVPNPSQRDTDADGYGNLCDADLDGDGLVTASDFFAEFRPCFGADLGVFPECEDADLDGDGLVAPGDFFAVFRPSMGLAPGPAGPLGQ